MATVRKKGNTWYVQWYDTLEKKTNSRSTGLPSTESNKAKAEKKAKEWQDQLNRKNRELKQLGIQRVTIGYAFEHFLRNNQSKHPKTIKDYKRFFNRFTNSFPAESSCTSITKVAVEDWLNELKQTHFQKNTIHGYGKQCTHFLNFLFEYNYTQMFKINREVKTRPEIKEKIVFGNEDIIKIFEELKDKNANFNALIHILFYTGLRSSDVLTISVEKIDLKERRFSYYSPKRKKHREVAFHDDLVPILTEAVERRKSGTILDYSNVENLGRAVHRYLHDLGIDVKGYSTRTFRKTFITLARSSFNMDASIVMELVGHEHGNTTDRYYNQISIAAMRKELKKFKRPR